MRWTTLLLSTIGLLAVGCTHMQPQTTITPKLVANIDSYYETKTMADLKTAVGSDKAKRNAVLQELILLSDHRYDEFVTRFHQGDATLQATFDSIALSLTTAAGIVSGGAAPILAGVAAGTQGTQAILNSRFLRDKTTESIIKIMDAQRAALKEPIIEKMAKAGYAAYPIEAGVADVLEMHRAGSIVRALVALSVEAGKKKTSAERKLDETKKRVAGFGCDESCAVLRKYVFQLDENGELATDAMGGPVVDPDRQNALVEWMRENDLGHLPAANLIFEADLAEERRKAVRALVIKD